MTYYFLKNDLIWFPWCLNQWVFSFPDWFSSQEFHIVFFCQNIRGITEGAMGEASLPKVPSRRQPQVGNADDGMCWAFLFGGRVFFSTKTRVVYVRIGWKIQLQSTLWSTTNYTTWKVDGATPMSGPLQIATFWEWLAIYFHYGVVDLSRFHPTHISQNPFFYRHTLGQTMTGSQRIMLPMDVEMVSVVAGTTKSWEAQRGEVKRWING